ncbi:MAG TPA: aryl-sulfate sulfotransferase [Myxococcota bacterium]|nr:aryl-sulfate sulfotransferase [Myxococcota bacterium]
MTLMLLACTPTETKVEFVQVERWAGDTGFEGERTLVGVNYPWTYQRIYALDGDAEVVGYYEIPEEIYGYDSGSHAALLMDFELLEGGNVVFAMSPKGLFEIDPLGELVWRMRDFHVSHDFDRLDNGNHLIARTWAEKGDKQIVERGEDGKDVWVWRGMKRYGEDPRFVDISDEGGAWMHITAVQRLDNGITRACIRNFNMIVDITPEGRVVNEIVLRSTTDQVATTTGRITGERPHGMETTEDGSILFGTRFPDRVIEVNADGQLLWKFRADGVTSIRDTDRLPTGNTLLSERTSVVETNPEGEIVWEWEAPEVEDQDVEMEDMSPIMTVLRIAEDGSFDNR